MLDYTSVPGKEMSCNASGMPCQHQVQVESGPAGHKSWQKAAAYMWFAFAEAAAMEVLQNAISWHDTEMQSGSDCHVLALRKWR